MEIAPEGSTSAASDTTYERWEPFPLPTPIPNWCEFAVSQHTKDLSHFCFSLREAGGLRGRQMGDHGWEGSEMQQGISSGQRNQVPPPCCWQAIRQGGKPAEGQPPPRAAESKKGFPGRPVWLGPHKLFSFSMVLWKMKASGIGMSYSVLQACLQAGRG